MKTDEIKNKVNITYKNNLDKFVQLSSLHAFVLSIIPLHITLMGGSVGAVILGLGIIVVLFLPIVCFVVPNFNPCIIRSFKLTLYEIRNNPETKVSNYFNNIFKYYWKNFSCAFLTNILWYIVMVLLAIPCSFSFDYFGPMLNQHGAFIGFLIVLLVYLPVLIVYVIKNIYNLKYSFSAYIIYDNPQIKVRDALKLSKQLLKNNSYSLFNVLSLKFSYAIWYILLIGITIPLCFIIIAPILIVPFFIGFELVNSYQTLSIIELYNELKIKGR